jgi:hypothetical protein
MNRRGSAPGGVAFQPLAQQHDEHRFGGGQVLAGRQRRNHRDANGQIRRDLLLEQSGDGVVEGAVSGYYRQNRRRVDAGNRAEDAGEVQKQQQANHSGQAEIAEPLLAFVVCVNR